MASNREISVRLKAEVAQYERDMGRAAKATTGFASSAQTALGNVKAAQSAQSDAAGQVRVAQLRLQEVQNNGKASAASLAQAEENLASAQRRSASAADVVKAAQAEASAVAEQSSTRMGRLAMAADANRESWSQVGGVLTGVGVAIAAVGTAAMVTGIQYNTLQQTSRAALTTLTGSASEANAQMDQLDAFARNSPFSKATFITAQQQMLGFGVEASKVLPTLDAIQNAVAAFGGSNNDIAEIAFIFSQIQAAGKITATDLMQLGQRGVDAATLIGSQMGMTGAQIRESITAGTLPAGEALDALAAGMAEKFDGAADNVKNTFAGAMDRVMAAWRDLSSELAAPFVGPEGGGLFTGLLNETADLMRGFQGLPGPVKTTAAGLSGLAGVGSLAAGTFLLLAPRIIETRRALTEMGPLANATASGFGKAAKATAILAAAFAAIRTAASFTDSGEAEGINTYTRALLDLERGAGGAQQRLDALFQVDKQSIPGIATFRQGIDGLDEAIKAIDPSKLNLEKITAALGFESMEQSARKAFDQVDASLAAMVSSGNLKEAERLFGSLNKQMRAEGVSGDKIDEVFSDYRDALAGVSEEQRAAVESSDKMADAAMSAAERMGMSVEEHEKLTEAAMKTGDAFTGLGGSFDDAKVSLGDWISELEEQNVALAKFTENSIQAARKGLDEGLIASLQEAGPAGALRLAELADASEKEIARANAAFRGGEEAARSYESVVANLPQEAITEFKTPGARDAISTAIEVAGKYNMTPEQVRTVLEALDYATDDIEKVLSGLNMVDGKVVTAQVRANADQAKIALGEVQRILNNMPLTRTIRVNTVRSGDDVGNAARAPSANGSLYVGPVKARAAGGLDEYGRGVPRVPQLRNGNQGTVMWGEPETGWEAYISGKPGMEDRNRGILADAAQRLGMQVTAFADGGVLDRLNAQRRVRDLQRDLRETEVVGKGRNRRRRRVLRGLDAQIAREELREARAELADLRRPVSQRRAAREQRAEDISRGTSDFMGNANLSEAQMRSPAAVERALSQSIADMATFTMLLIELKKKGASPWLLGQLQSFGPGKGTIKLARQYLADNAKLRSTNALAAQAQEVSRVYGSITTDARWDATKAWTPAMRASTAANLTKLEQSLTVQLDGSYLDREVARLVSHHMDAGARKMGAFG